MLVYHCTCFLPTVTEETSLQIQQLRIFSQRFLEGHLLVLRQLQLERTHQCLHPYRLSLGRCKKGCVQDHIFDLTAGKFKLSAQVVKINVFLRNLLGE